MDQMATARVNKDRVQDVCSNDGDDTEERGPPELFRAREDDGGNVGAKLEGVLPRSFDSGERPAMSSLHILCAP
jgi:hypothetical protein